MTDIYMRIRKLEAEMTEVFNLSVKKYLSHRKSALKNMCEPDVKPEFGTLQHLLPPNPGSELAQAMGCTCPVIDNHHGQGWHGRAGLFVYTFGCPVHAPANAEAIDATRTGEEG